MTLRRHLVTCHLAEWVTACDKANIQISGDGTFGEMIAEFRGESKSKLTDCGNLLNESPMFTKTAFVDAIVGLIVMEDLISDVMSFLVSFWVLICYGRCFKPLSIVESVSLRQLFLMLRKELRYPTQNHYPGSSGGGSNGAFQ